jgi:hypothetical protein
MLDKNYGGSDSNLVHPKPSPSDPKMKRQKQLRRDLDLIVGDLWSRFQSADSEQADQGRVQ